MECDEKDIEHKNIVKDTNIKAMHSMIIPEPCDGDECGELYYIYIYI